MQSHRSAAWVPVYGTSVVDRVSQRRLPRHEPWKRPAYCLMDNYHHRLIETPPVNPSQGMRQLNGRYTWAFNRHHERFGHLATLSRRLKQVERADR